MKAPCENSFKIEESPFTSIYEVSSEIGRGKFAVVKKCKHRQSGLEFAAKFVRKRRKGVDCRRDVLHEISMLRAAVHHPHFVSLLEVYENVHEMILVTELMRGGELFQYITADGQIDEACTVQLMRQVVEGLVFLHRKNIVHLDIKPQNILLTGGLPDCSIKLCDLGLARVVNRGEDVFEIIGTPDYVAPEILDYQKLNVACDMWSVGVLAYVMLSGCSPFAGDTNQETFLNISQVNLDFPDDLFRTISSRAIDFIKKLLLKEPENRLTAKECLDHPWLKSHVQLPSSPSSSSSSSSLLGASVSKPEHHCSNNGDDKPADPQEEDSNETLSHHQQQHQQQQQQQQQPPTPIPNSIPIISDDEAPPPTKIGLLEARKPGHALHELQNMELLPSSSLSSSSSSSSSSSRRIWTSVATGGGATCENWEPSGIPA